MVGAIQQTGIMALACLMLANVPSTVWARAVVGESRLRQEQAQQEIVNTLDRLIEAIERDRAVVSSPGPKVEPPGPFDDLIELIERENAAHRPAIAEKPKPADPPADALIKDVSRLVKKVDAAKQQVQAAKNEFAQFGPPEEAQSEPPRPSTPPTETNVPNAKPQDAESPLALLKRYHDVQIELARLNNRPAPKAPADGQLYVVAETPHLGSAWYTNNEQTRAFAVRLLFVNTTQRDLMLKRAGITLEADKKPFKVPANLNDGQFHRSFSIGQKSYNLTSLKTPETLAIPAGKTASTWVAFGGLSMNPPVPDLILTLDFGTHKQELNLNEFSRGLLKARIERLGPKDCLALVTIAGTLDHVNVRSLVDELDELAVTQKVARVVIRWEKDAPPVESNLLSWLQKSATQAGQPQPNNPNPNNSNPYPLVPLSIRELHLAELPKESSQSTSNGTQSRLHQTSGEAIIAALRTAYQALSANEIVDDLRHNDPVIRAAALMGGGGRLPPDKLPVLLEFVNSNDRHLQRAAIFALRNFGEEAAIRQLINLVQQNEKPKSTEAAESLATSRFAGASEALLDLLAKAEPGVKTNIVQVLAKYPRPIWGETIAEYARHPETGIGLEALRALVRIGHPELVSLLESALRQNDPQVRQVAFNVLAGRTDQRSEQLAMDYVLKRLRTEPPSGAMNSLIIRTKDPRVIPLLMRHFQNKNGSRTALIQLMTQIGDRSVVDLLVSSYPQLSTSEKRAVLDGLQKLHAPEFLPLAANALTTNDSSLLNTAANGLYKDGSDRAEQALIDALQSDAKHAYWSYLCNALANFGTPKARTALRLARDSDQDQKKNAAQNALRSLQQRSPGYQYVSQAQQTLKQREWEQAAQQFTLAIQADSELTEAYAGRGTAYLNLNKLKEAKADFQRAVKTDPESSQAHTGVAIMMVMENQIAEGIDYAEAARKKFADPENVSQAVLAYNVACVYGRAVEKLSRAPADKKRDQQLETYQTKALAELQDALKNGFSDFDLMKHDPDLKSLEKLPAFQKLLPQANAPKRVRPNLSLRVNP